MKLRANGARQQPVRPLNDKGATQLLEKVVKSKEVAALLLVAQPRVRDREAIDAERLLELIEQGLHLRGGLRHIEIGESGVGSLCLIASFPCVSLQCLHA